MDSNFWKNKRVVVTGYNGFKGCWLSKWLDMLGARVLGIALDADEKSGINGLIFSNSFQQLIGDVRQKETFQAVQEFEPEIVIHLAAQAIVKTAKEKPVETFETNVMGTVNLLESLRDCSSVKSILIVTSDKVYQNKETGEAYLETAPLYGEEAYSCSKVCQEMVVKAYFEIFFRDKHVGVATARACNTYGGGDYHFDRLIPYLHQCAFLGQEPLIRNRDAVRPWQYVLDVIHGYFMLCEALYSQPDLKSGSYNFGPNQDQLYTVGDMADLICGKSKDDGIQLFYEAGLLSLDSTKSKVKLGWAPVYGIERGLEQTALAYQTFFSEGNTDALYEERIRVFQKELLV